jgi:CheY-like chemotaxis protein
VDAATTKAAPRSAHVGRQPGQETILLVEDERPVRAVIARSLQRYGYRVIEATSGTEAADLLRNTNERIDLLLSDLVLPGLTGLELVEVGRKLRPGLRALLCSGYSEDAISRRGVTADVRVLPKPFEPSELLDAVRAALDDEELGEALS